MISIEIWNQYSFSGFDSFLNWICSILKLQSKWDQISWNRSKFSFLPHQTWLYFQIVSENGSETVIRFRLYIYIYGNDRAWLRTFPFSSGDFVFPRCCAVIFAAALWLSRYRVSHGINRFPLNSLFIPCLTYLISGSWKWSRTKWNDRWLELIQSLNGGNMTVFISGGNVSNI